MRQGKEGGVVQEKANECGWRTEKSRSQVSCAGTTDPGVLSLDPSVSLPQGIKVQVSPLTQWMPPSHVLKDNYSL